MSVGEATMAKRETTPIRVDNDALHLARIAASYKGVPLIDYLGEVIKQRAQEDIDREHARLSGARPATRGRKGGKPPGE